jgi:prepilin-type N-terminal cleavage/methylation domain-containing protein
MRTRRGFTLVEVMVALVVTALVVSLAYTSAHAGFDTSDRVARARAGSESESIARALIVDGLRHALPGLRGGRPVFTLTRVRMPDGTPSDALRFLTRGTLQPFGTSEPWEMTIAPGRSGLRIHARATEGSDTTSIDAELPDIRAMRVQVLSRDSRDGWLDAWDDPERSPVAAAITFFDRSGKANSAPIVVRVGLEGNP